MINRELLNPQSIVVVGGSEDLTRPGGKVLKNIQDGSYKGQLYVVNPKYRQVMGSPSYPSVRECPSVELAILAIPAQYIKESILELVTQKKCKAFIIFSAGFSEMGEEGKNLEKEIVSILNKHEASLIGPNCIGVMTSQYNGIFAGAIPVLNPKGCDFVSSSGATAAFIIDKGIPLGLSFASIFSVGNAAQIGVEEVLQYWDETYHLETSSSVKMIYMESVHNPPKFLKHAASLVKKGCRLVAIKAGCSEAGERAASSHTGALASSNTAVEAMLRKAGVVRCYSAEELLTVASVFMHPPLEGKRVAVITHAGGPGVMITDALSQGGLEVPPFTGSAALMLKEKLFPGSSTANPIDFLATGTAEQLGYIIDTVEREFDIDAMVVIFGTPGLEDVTHVYQLLDQKMKNCSKPVYPVLPSITTAYSAIQKFKSLGRVFFPDEVVLAKALSRIVSTPKPAVMDQERDDLFFIEESIDKVTIRQIVEEAQEGYLPPQKVVALLDAVGISRVTEEICATEEEALDAVQLIHFPLVMKVVGPVHKTDMGGVALNIQTTDQVKETFHRLINLPKAKAVLIQPQLSGRELFMGAKREGHFGHLILCGLGGIFIEVLKDTAAALTPVTPEEGLQMIRSLKGYGMIKGVRGQEGIDEEKMAQTLYRLSWLLKVAPEIKELDINPLLGNAHSIIAVDARIAL